MGAMFRRYWVPACLSSQLPHTDSDPLRVRLLGESLVAFRDSKGAVGLLDEFCPHRRASLALGRVEECGLRCLYHGWKFAVDGRIQDTPNYSGPKFNERVKAKSYPVREEAGIVWTYMGPSDKQPPFQRYGFMDAPATHRTALRMNVRCNYLQLAEGGFDSSHVGILHSNMARPGWLSKSFTPNPDVLNPAALAVEDNAPELDIEPTDFGFYYSAFRSTGHDDRTNVRVVPFIMPSTRIIPSPATEFTVFETPMDDESTSTYIIVSGEVPIERPKILEILGLHDARYYDEKTCKWLQTWENNMGQDRSRLSENWSGLGGVQQEDAAMSLSMGPIVDRTQEHLVPADFAVVTLRRMLMAAAKAVAAGGNPIGTRTDLSDVRALDRTLTVGTSWKDLCPGHWIRGATNRGEKTSESV
jgi:phenylpropionate dioxygenase-like ring-hydroxylating dioxygenase large terminal subunit